VGGQPCLVVDLLGFVDSCLLVAVDAHWALHLCGA